MLAYAERRKQEGGGSKLRLLLHGSMRLRSASLTKALLGAFCDYSHNFLTIQVLPKAYYRVNTQFNS